MNIKLFIHNNKILLEYKPRDGIGWLEEIFYNQDGTYKIKDIFEVSDTDFYSEEPYLISDACGYFVIGEADNNYYCIFKHILNTNYDILISKTADINLKYFGISTDYNLNVLKKIEELIDSQVIISDKVDTQNACIPIKAFESLIAQFPTRTEQIYYTNAKITNILEEYVESTLDGQNRFDNYLKRKNKRLVKYINNLKSLNHYEIQKYEFVLDILKNMIANSEQYDENDWQDKILEIVLLLFPKYIFYIKEFKIPDLTKISKERHIDIALFDANGNIDIIEIKKPNAGNIISENLYRNNHIPTRTLAGSVMQTEKYLYLLNLLGQTGENKLNEKYQSKLQQYNIKIKINNPRGIVIAGDTTNYTEQQHLDFDIIRRKYMRIVDIISYNDLINRLDNILNALKHKN